MLKPDPALSMAVKISDPFVAVLVSFQHPPQLGELNATPGAPPIKGKVGIFPNVGNRAARPFAPFEHATPLSEPALLSYVVSNVAFTVVARVLGATCGRAWATCVRRSARAKVMKIIVNEQEKEQERDCRSRWVMIDELLEGKQAWFYTRCEAHYQQQVRQCISSEDAKQVVN